MRSHVCFMTKKDNDGTKLLTCYFDDCAVNSQLGRNRDGSDFTDEDARTTHWWSAAR